MHNYGRLCDGSVFGETEGHGRSLKVMEDKWLAVSSMSYFVQMAPRITVIRKLSVLGLDWPGLTWIWTWQLDLGLTINIPLHLSLQVSVFT